MADKKYHQFPYQNADPAYYGQLKIWAKENRRNPTVAEQIFRNAVRCNQLGHKFLFQYIIGQYIVDFLCPDSRLVVEIDGGYHSEPRQQEDDAVRAHSLRDMGYRIIRFSNDEVLNDITNVIEKVNKLIEK